jgi:hypothetical protein
LNLEFLTIYVENERMVEVVTGKRAKAVRAKEFVLVQHISQDALDLLFVADRQNPASLVSDESIVCGSDMLDKLRVALLEQYDELLKSRVAFNNSWLKNCGSAQRQKSNHGPDFQTHSITIREVEQIIKEPTFGVPHFVLRWRFNEVNLKS